MPKAMLLVKLVQRVTMLQQGVTRSNDVVTMGIDVVTRGNDVVTRGNNEQGNSGALFFNKKHFCPGKITINTA